MKVRFLIYLKLFIIKAPFPWRFKNKKGEIRIGENIKEYLTTDEKKTLTFGAMFAADGTVKWPLIIDRSVPCDAEFRRNVRNYGEFKHAEVVINDQRCQFHVTKRKWSSISGQSCKF